MAGGIFTSQPFQFNLKCVVFGSALSAGYWTVAAHPSLINVGIIYILAYVAMAWYDWAYGCSTPLLTGSNGAVGYIDSIWKPWNSRALKREQYAGTSAAEREPLGETLLSPSYQCYQYVKHVWAFQILVVTPLLLYLGYWSSVGAVSNIALAVGFLGVGWAAARLFLVV